MSEATLPDRASFRRMDESTEQDWKIIGRHNAGFSAGLADRVLTHLQLLDGQFDGFPVSRLEHSLQTATLCHQAGKDEEYVVCALLHDIGDTLASYNHADIAADILKPFVSEQNHWIVAHHGILQGYYFFHHIGLDRNMREQYRDHEHFEACAEFCRFDQAAFDPDFESLPLETFEPMVRNVFAKPKRSIYLRESA
jgi:predicted HD phosphohydrolase